jgi:hypothetical protein
MLPEITGASPMLKVTDLAATITFHRQTLGLSVQNPMSDNFGEFTLRTRTKMEQPASDVLRRREFESAQEV